MIMNYILDAPKHKFLMRIAYFQFSIEKENLKMQPPSFLTQISQQPNYAHTNPTKYIIYTNLPIVPSREISGIVHSDGVS